MAAKDKYSLGQRLGFWLAAFVGTWLMKAILATCRIELLNKEIQLYKELLSREVNLGGLTVKDVLLL